MSDAVRDRSPELASASCPQPALRSANGRTAKPRTEGAVRGDGSECPVARVLRELWPGCEPHVEGSSPYVTDPDGTRVRLLLSTGLIEEIRKFDRGEPAFEGMIIEVVPERSRP